MDITSYDLEMADEDIVDFPEKDRSRGIRRKKSFSAQNRLDARAKTASGYPGLYFDEKRGHAGIVERGRLSRYLKRQSNKKLRQDKNPARLHGGVYKKVYDYWWELN